MAQLAIHQDDIAPPQSRDFEVTIDLAFLAQVGRGDRIEIDVQGDKTLELFSKTLKVVDGRAEESGETDYSQRKLDPNRYMPEHGDLRKRFIFAETLGSYSTLHDLLDQYSQLQIVVY